MKRVKKVFHRVHNHTSCIIANDDTEYSLVDDLGIRIEFGLFLVSKKNERSIPW